MSHSHSLGFLAGALAAGALSLAFGLLVLVCLANQVAAGLAIGLLGLGVSALVGKPFEGNTIPPLPKLNVLGLAHVPIVGPILFGQDILVYAGVALIAVLAWIFKRTKLGLIIRAVGEAPTAARDIGYPVVAIRFGCVAFGGLLAGIGGAYLSIAYTALWTEGLVAGRGWIAVALVVFGSWIPLRIADRRLRVRRNLAFGTLNPGAWIECPIAVPFSFALHRYNCRTRRDFARCDVPAAEPARRAREGFSKRRMISHLTGEVCMTITQRFLAIAFALAIAMLGSGSASAQKAKIGVIYPSPIGEVGWAHELDVGRQAIADKLGDKVEFINAENIPEGPDAQRIINQMASENPKLIILGSFGYMNDGMRLAAKRPDIDFIHASGYKTTQNFGWFLARNYESAYVAGNRRRVRHQVKDTRRGGRVSYPRSAWP